MNGIPPYMSQAAFMAAFPNNDRSSRTFTEDTNALYDLSVSDATFESLTPTSINAVFTITVSPAPKDGIFVDFTTRDGTALAIADDYTLTSDRLWFQPGQTTLNVLVPVQTTQDNGSTFYLDVSWPNQTANTTSRGTGACTLQDSIMVYQTLTYVAPPA